MDEELYDDVRVAPPPRTSSSSKHPSSTVRALTAKEWAQVEDVSTSVRAVGQVMSQEAERIAANLPPQEPEPFAFSRERYVALKEKRNNSEKVVVVDKKKSRRDGIIKQQEAKLVAQDQERIAAAAESSVVPRLEGFGGRMESFVAAMLSWAKNKKFCPLDVIISLHKLDNMIESRCPSDEIQDAKKDINCTIEKIVKKVGHTTLLKLAVDREELLSCPSFMPPGRLQLYPEQREVAAIVAEAVKDPSLVRLVRYITPPSGGKSSAAALFGAVVLRARDSFMPKGGTLGPVLVYACFSNAVRIEVSKTLIAASVPFGMLTSGVVSLSYKCSDGKKRLPPMPEEANIEERIRASLTKAAACDRPPAVFVCDLESARVLVSMPERNDPLVVDEPTAGIEAAAHMAILCAKLMAVAPNCTILMSATVPDFSEMPLLVKLTKAKYARAMRRRRRSSTVEDKWGNLACDILCTSVLEWTVDDDSDHDIFRTVYSKRLPVGLKALDSSGKLWCPHHACSSSEDLVEFLETLPGDSHLLRFYCASALADVVDEIKDSSKQTPPFEAKDLFSHDAIRAACVRLMRNYQEHLKINVISYDQNELRTVDMTRALAHKFPGTTLVVTNDVESFYEDAMIPLLADTKTDTLRRIIRKMDTAEAAEDDRIKRTSSTSSSKQRKKLKIEGNNVSDPEENEEVPPRTAIPWPSIAVLNSKEHHGRFAPSSAIQAKVKSMPDVPDEVVRGSAEALVESALSGVMLLNTRWSDTAFELSAIALADKSSPSLIIADTSMVYGVNLPIDRALVLTSPGSLSLSEIRQFCGRAGRTGKALKAEVVFGAASRHDLLSALRVPRPDDVHRADLDVAIAAAAASQ